MRAGAGRWLRSLAGVEDDIFREYRGEMARYTSLGGVLLATAAFAAFSMAIAIGQIFDGFAWWHLAPAIGWGLAVLNLDRWLVSNTSTTGTIRRALTYLPRLAIAVLLGAIVAVPLVLKVFDTAIVQHVQVERQEAIGAYETLLTNCNAPQSEALVAAAASEPTGGRSAGTIESDNGTDAAGADGDGESDDDCSDAIVAVELESEPGTLLREQDELTDQIERLRSTIESDEEQLGELQQAAFNECNGVSGPGLTGLAGEGLNCEERRAEADRFAESADLGEQRATLRRLEADLDELSGKITTSAGRGRAAIDRTIADDIADRVRIVDDPETDEPFDASIGFMERLGALFELSERDRTLEMSHWAVTLFFILFDAAPVVIKFLSGRSTYDELVTAELAQASEVLQLQRTARLRAAALRHEVRIAKLEAEAQTELAAIEADFGPDRPRTDRTWVGTSGSANGQHPARIDPSPAGDDGLSIDEGTVIDLTDSALNAETPVSADAAPTVQIPIPPAPHDEDPPDAAHGAPRDYPYRFEGPVATGANRPTWSDYETER